MPTVSVAMGIYNGEKYLVEAVESILEQTYTDFELIICDDGSIDKSCALIEELMSRDKRIVLIRNEKNMGLAYSLNRCIDAAKGKYIARMDCDDISKLDRFEKQVKYLDEHPEIAFVGGSAEMFDDNGVWGIHSPISSLSKEIIFSKHPVIHPTVMIRTDVLREVGKYTVSAYTLRNEDFDLWCKIYYHGYKGSNLQEVLIKYREDHHSYSRRKYRYRYDNFRLKLTWRKKLNLPCFYYYYSILPLVKGIVPSSLIRGYHNVRFSIKNNTKMSILL